ncbi:cell division protein FtsK, partial [Protofrankia symbiont of Coriaria myrtifolia]
PWTPDTTTPTTPTAAPVALTGDVLDRRALTGRVIGRWLSGGQEGRIVVLGYPKTDSADPADAPGAVAGRAAVRTLYRIWRGHLSFARRMADAATYGAIREQIRAARAAGDKAALAEWVDRLREAKTARHDRLRGMPVLIGSLAVSTGSGLGLAGVVIGAGGIAVGLTHPAGWTWSGYWDFWATLAHVGLTAAVVTLRVGTWLAVPGWLALTWRAGRAEGNAPRWLATAAEADIDMEIDENTITQALKALRLPPITDYLKTGAPLQYLTTARKDGRGTHAVIRLPGALSAEKVAKRRPDLAAGLHRLSKEVWIKTGDEAGILDLWIADKGALAEGAGPYPLLDDGLTDVFKGVPFGKTLRGDPLVAPIMECNTIVGGMPGHGKSAGARTIMLGAALDPTAELRIWIPDNNFDFDGFRRRCSRFVMGTDPEHFAQIAEDLRELHAEVQARGKLLGTYEEPSVTRALASKGIGLHPVVCLLEEAHVAINHETYGKEIAHLLVEIVRLGRKRGIHLIVSTQAPTRDSIPRDVTRNCSNGIAYAVGDHVANDALLGQGAYRAGHRATDLVPGLDRGVAVVKGFTGERSQIANGHFLSVSKGNDQVGPLIRRSLDAIARTGRPVPGTDRPRADIPTESRDLLDDLDAVLGTDPVKTADIPAQLRKLAPDWEPYRTLTGTQLRELLTAEGIKVPSTGNRHPLDPVTVREHIARRSTADIDE